MKINKAIMNAKEWQLSAQVETRYSVTGVPVMWLAVHTRMQMKKDL